MVLAADNSGSDYFGGYEALFLTFHDSQGSMVCFTDYGVFGIFDVNLATPSMHIFTPEMVDSKPAGSSLAWQSGMLEGQREKPKCD